MVLRFPLRPPLLLFASKTHQCCRSAPGDIAWREAILLLLLFLLLLLLLLFSLLVLLVALLLSISWREAIYHPPPCARIKLHQLLLGLCVKSPVCYEHIELMLTQCPRVHVLDKGNEAENIRVDPCGMRCRAVEHLANHEVTIVRIYRMNLCKAQANVLLPKGHLPLASGQVCRGMVTRHLNKTSLLVFGSAPEAVLWLPCIQTTLLVLGAFITEIFGKRHELGAAPGWVLLRLCQKPVAVVWV